MEQRMINAISTLADHLPDEDKLRLAERMIDRFRIDELEMASVGPWKPTPEQREKFEELRHLVERVQGGAASILRRADDRKAVV